MKILRNKLGSNVLITAAVSVTPFEKNGQPVSDLSEFAKIFDFINIMAYDVIFIKSLILSIKIIYYYICN